jgi:hypothetical protein
MTVRRSWQHMAASITLCAATLGWFAVRGASAWEYAEVVGLGAFYVGYNVVRIGRARVALRDPSELESFAAGQRQSHRVRGRVFLVAAPILVAATWIGALRAPRLPMDSWVVLVATTLFLLGGWVWWLRVVRRLA